MEKGFGGVFMKKLLFLLVLILCLIPKLIVVTKHPIATGWDAPYYMKTMKKFDLSKYDGEPLFFLLAVPLNKLLTETFFGIMPYGRLTFSPRAEAIVLILSSFKVIKLMKIGSFLLLIISTYLLISKFYGWKTALLITLLTGYLPHVTRIWDDTLRNFLALSLFPLFLLTFLERKTLLSAVFLGLIGLSHRLVFFYAVAGILLFLLVKLFRKEEIKESLIRCGSIILIGFILSFPYFYKGYFVKKGKIARESSLIFKWDVSPLTEFIKPGWESIWLIPVFASLYFVFPPRKDEDIFIFSLASFSLFLALGLLGTPHLIYSRFIYSSGYFLLLALSPLFSHIFNNFSPLNASILIFFFLCLLPQVFQGYKYMMTMHPFITNEEMMAIWNNYGNLTANQTAVLVPSRLHYWMEGLLDRELNKTLFVAEWYSLTGDYPPTNESLVFNGKLEESLTALKNLFKGRNLKRVFLVWTDGWDPIKRDRIMEKIRAGLLRCYKIGGTNFCRVDLDVIKNG
ncbi:hypothetical protein J7L81_04630 [Candidatus Aerophobetes bacterium]|nr:hypothetical protein [Candidatus Aerophobetes bacterium]